MTRPRGGGGSGSSGDPPTGGSDRPPGRFRNPPDASSVSAAQQTIAQTAQQGRPIAAGSSGSGQGSGGSQPQNPRDVQLHDAMGRYDALGDDPPTLNIAANDLAFSAHGAHTGVRHGPDVPLPRNPGDPNTHTIEGRIYGDPPWGRPENYSYRWTDHTTMNRTINDHVQANWDQIRSDLVMNGVYRQTFDAGHRVGEGYYNDGMYGAGPQQSRYSETSRVTITIRIVPGANPPQPYIVTAFPDGR